MKVKSFLLVIVALVGAASAVGLLSGCAGAQQSHSKRASWPKPVVENLRSRMNKHGQIWLWGLRARAGCSIVGKSDSEALRVLTSANCSHGRNTENFLYRVPGSIVEYACPNDGGRGPCPRLRDCQLRELQRVIRWNGSADPTLTEYRSWLRKSERSIRRALGGRGGLNRHCLIEATSRAKDDAARARGFSGSG